MAENTIKDVKLKIGTETQFQSKLKDLPLNTLVGTTDPIQEGELDTSIITKLNKADNALPKPTNDTTGSAGQVLKKTANGSEWGDAPSGGGKLYIHRVSLKFGLPSSDEYYITVPSSDPTPITKETANRLIYGFLEEINGSNGAYVSGAVKNATAYESSNLVSIDGTIDQLSFAGTIESDTVLER